MAIKDYSYGIVPLRQTGPGDWQVLLIQHQAGHWAFPKGHANEGETPQQAAVRELEEETGLSVVQFLSEETLMENYYFFLKGKRFFKTVVYFMAKVQGDVKIQEEEICNSAWVAIPQAKERMTFPEGKKVCQAVQQYLNLIN